VVPLADIQYCERVNPRFFAFYFRFVSVLFPFRFRFVSVSKSFTNRFVSVTKAFENRLKIDYKSFQFRFVFRLAFVLSANDQFSV
jgi:hypothetical protein